MYMYSTQLQGLDISSIPHGKNPLWKTVGTTIEIILSTESNLIFFLLLNFLSLCFPEKTFNKLTISYNTRTCYYATCHH